MTKHKHAWPSELKERGLKLNVLWLSRVKEFGKEELIPSVLKARQTPMHAICIAYRVGQLLGGQWAPLLLVDRCVRVFTITWELGNVEKCNWHLWFTKHFSNHLHYTLSAVWTPICWVFNHLCFIVAVSSFFASPVYAPSLFTQSFNSTLVSNSCQWVW